MQYKDKKNTRNRQNKQTKFVADRIFDMTEETVIFSSL